MFVNTGCADKLTSLAVGSSQPVGSALAVLFVFFLFFLNSRKDTVGSLLSRIYCRTELIFLNFPEHG